MDNVYAEFSYCVDELRDYPNRDLIVRLTQLALENVVIAEKLGNVVMAKLIHPQTLSTYKKPLYYVVDSILKKVGGPYPVYFQNALSEHFPKTVQDVNEEDRRKLDFLFGTWEERKVLSLDLLAKMRQLLKQQPSFPRQVVQPQYQYQPALQNMPLVVGGGTMPMTMNNSYQNSDIYKDLIANEMVSVLNSVLAELRMINPITLDELSVMNPALFAQIRSKAEQNALAIMQQRMMMQQQQQQPVYTQQNQYANSNSSAAGMNNVGFGNGAVGCVPQQRTMPQQQYQQVIPSQQYQLQQQQQFQPHQSGGQVPRQGIKKRSVADVYPQPPHTDAQYPTSLAVSVPSSSQGSMMPAPPPELVTGYICEAQTSVSVSRLQTLSHRLNSLSSNPQGQFSPLLGMVSGRLSQRLQDYLPALMQPPPLPDILTDGRFFSNSSSGSQPQTQNTATSTSQVNASVVQGSNSMMRFQPPPPPRAEKPEFKLLDFDRQPELKSRALRNLYDGRPHQCYEDGLRFSNLQQLRQHTDAILERKKLLKKKSDRKEPQNREWFCTLPQWITNFQSTVLGTLNGDATSNGQPVGSGVASAVIAEVAEEFVTPADENFTRCPISGEVFQAVWDDEEGEMMYRNAVKVLLPPGSESNMYNMARPVEGTGASTGVKYMIVHKLFGVDKWLQERKAKPLSDLPPEELVTQQLKEAAGEEDAEDIFVLLNQSLRL